MRPGPDVFRQPQTRDDDSARVQRRAVEAGEAGNLLLLGEDQQRLIGALQGQAHGMTVRQLQTRLSWSRSMVQRTVDGLLERQVVARLNTVIPSYVYRYGGVDLNAD